MERSAGFVYATGFDVSAKRRGAPRSERQLACSIQRRRPNALPRMDMSSDPQHYVFSCISSEFSGKRALKSDLFQSGTTQRLRSTRCCSLLSRRTHEVSVFAVADVTTEEKRTLPRFIQHKKEAYWFYRFLSIIYDDVINPLHWTVEMRDSSLEIAGLEGIRDKNPVVVDVGGGTGFTTEGIVKYINPSNITILDQSPHQLEKARAKPSLQACKIIEGDAEDLPFETDSCDRYVSAGSIEYWPEPQRGIAEAYRILRSGGIATIIGPIRPTNSFSRLFADIWMLFPEEHEYKKWFSNAGFTDIKIKYITPKLYKGIRQHGLIMGISISGVKSRPGNPLIKLGPKVERRVVEEKKETLMETLLFPFRFILGTLAGIYYAVLPLVIILYAALFIREPKSQE